jgi:hypothetical protein
MPPDSVSKRLAPVADFHNVTTELSLEELGTPSTRARVAVHEESQGEGIDEGKCDARVDHIGHAG